MKVAIFALVLSLLIGSVVMANSSAVNDPSVEGPLKFEPSTDIKPGDSIEVPSSSDPEITPFNVTLIDNVKHSGKTAYEKTFELSPGNGKELNIYVKNNHSSKKVKFKVERTDNGQDFGYVTIEPGGSKTRNFTMDSGKGMSGKWKVYVTSDDGHVMDLLINARQF